MTIKKYSGFTLLELMVAVAVMAILSAIAYPLYESQSRKGKRPDGIALLEKIVLMEQQYFSHMGVFTSTVTDLTGIKSAISPGGHYKVTVVVNANSFIATAEPISAGQKKDLCEFTLSNLGVRGVTVKDAGGTSVPADDATRIRCLGK